MWECAQNRVEAVFNRKIPRGTIIYTDRGSQYWSRTALVASTSVKSNCYDNAAMESWNHSFKLKAIHEERFATREQARQTCLSTSRLTKIETART